MTSVSDIRQGGERQMLGVFGGNIGLSCLDTRVSPRIDNSQVSLNNLVDSGTTEQDCEGDNSGQR